MYMNNLLQRISIGLVVPTPVRTVCRLETQRQLRERGSA
jgi:hypothetical protein